ncbi:PH domain-containing protein [Gracilibacillus sp. S3-1-1]|uniref:PH domain-containing protein n=1 Tax=Gracilibacillus pellucidus TaxID=3095368 RepID=A0ACC6M3T9_9BACI|nr:PH domain-containing protein [Gracilibacillus sp. S3-1-1]MDX8045624.1 PH domain-containing protein [Gracilibacillus sp. S3-1-1]
MRYHPMVILFQIYQLVKENVLFALVLFVFQKDSDFWLFVYGKYVFVAYVSLRFIYIVSSWFVETYEWQDRTFYLKKGVLTKKTMTIPFSKIQNVTKKTTLFHKLFGLTSLYFETVLDGEDSTIVFPVVTKQQATKIVVMVNVQEGKEVVKEKEKEKTEKVDPSIPEQEVRSDSTIHYEPTSKDLLKASFTSLSFLIIIPIISGLYDIFESFITQYQGIFKDSLSILSLSIVVVIIAISIGVIRTFLKYGEYRISSNDSRIFIDRGVVEKSQFAIEKRKVQGIEIKQNVMTRMFGLVEVTLISSFNPEVEDSDVSVNSLYPFLPVKKAYQLIEELLPGYYVHQSMQRLARASLWMKLIKPSWLWLIATACLIYFKPTVFKIESTWWLASLVLLIIVVVNRLLDYWHTKYLIAGDQVQWWHGGLVSKLFLTKRKNIIEMGYSQSVLQRILKLGSITTMNRSNPTRIETVADVPTEFIQSFQRWYKDRQADIHNQ